MASAISNFLVAIWRCSREVRSKSFISTRARSPWTVRSPCRPAWAPAAARFVHVSRISAGSLAGKAGIPETTVKRFENTRSLAATSARILASPWGSAPPATVNSGIAMLSFLAPVPITLSNTSAGVCDRTARGMVSTPPAMARAIAHSRMTGKT